METLVERLGCLAQVVRQKPRVLCNNRLFLLGQNMKGNKENVGGRQAMIQVQEKK